VVALLNYISDINSTGNVGAVLIPPEDTRPDEHAPGFLRVDGRRRRHELHVLLVPSASQLAASGRGGRLPGGNQGISIFLN
jgi:hypothetical protein